MVFTESYYFHNNFLPTFTSQFSFHHHHFCHSHSLRLGNSVTNSCDRNSFPLETLYRLSRHVQTQGRLRAAWKKSDSVAEKRSEAENGSVFTFILEVEVEVEDSKTFCPPLSSQLSQATSKHASTG